MAGCGLDTVLSLIGGKWKMLILCHLCYAPRRFGELRRLIPGISEKMLIQDLRQMQENRLLVRKDYRQVPPKVEYSITPLGRSLGNSLAPLCAWGGKHKSLLSLSESGADARNGSGNRLKAKSAAGD